MAWVKLCATDEVPVGTSRLCEAGGKKIALFHISEGFFALDDHCPHRSGPMSEGMVEDGAVSCPWHQWVFDLKTGTCRNIPGQKIKTFSIKEKDGQIEADL